MENLTLTGSSDIGGIGNAGNNVITGNAGANVLNGGAGTDTLIGGLGHDTYIVDSTTDTITEAAGAGTDTVQSSVAFSLAAIANVENLTLTGTASINGTGNAASNIIYGNSGANVLDGGVGADILQGGAGNDTYVVDSGGDTVIEQAGGGTDTVQTSVSIGTLADFVENLLLTGTGNISGMGNGLNNVITGNSGDNLLRGADGVDTLIGGAGNDTYNVDTTTDTITELSGGGTDLVQSSVTFSLAALANVENLTLTGKSVINGTGNAGNNVITGNSVANVLDGGAGIDTLVGGDGDDTYIVDSTTDTITEAAGAGTGTDTVRSSVAFSLAANVENLTLTGTGNINGTGNAAVNVITGTAGNNVLDGGAGADTLIGGAGNDTYIVDDAGDVVTEAASAGTDTVQSSVTISSLALNVENLVLTGGGDISGTGNTLNNVITGNSGSNILNGGAGTDTLIGGAGNDIYIVDTTTDTITELAGGGTDSVQSFVAFSLAALANVEDLRLNGGDNINGTGNSLNNVINGNTGDNVLDGGTGIDTLVGGTGNDTYIVDTTTDTITEASSAGTDTVQSSVAFSLAAIANVENLTLTGTGNINGTGNSVGNVITGTSGANVLDGGAGNDTLVGGAGNDTYIVDADGDVVTELKNGGTDTVQSSVTISSLAANVENLTLTGSSAINGTGNTLNNVITGNSAANILTGGDGTDTLIGGTGNDTYVVDTTTDTITEAAFEGTDLVQSSVAFSLAALANVENLTLTGTSAINGTGNAENNVITGNSGANVLNGGVGIDRLVGGDGNDTYIVDTATDFIIEDADKGTDTVQSSASITLATNVEKLTLTGTASINGTGNVLDNVITGNSGANELTGGEGTDTLIGGAGNDTYIVDTTTDTITELANGGTDTVKSSVSFSLAAIANVENLTLDGGEDETYATGNALNNVITGDIYVNQLEGGDGIDTLIGGAGNDTYVVDTTTDTIIEKEGEGYDTVQSTVSFTLAALANVESLSLNGTADINGTGNAGNNTIYGNSGANVLNGGAGNDSLIGGKGNDTYIVDSAGDSIVEWLDGGTDTVQSSVTFSLSVYVENLTLTGTGAINGTGNDLANVITGTSGANVLNGGEGADTLIGGAGNDTYIVDNDGDVVTELNNGGTDTVQSSVSIVSLAANVENLTLTGDAAINGTGNALDNVIIGNDSANVLYGDAGNDVFVINGNIALIDEGEIIDAINGGAGTDTLRLGAAEFTLDPGYTLVNISQVESITAVATENAISLTFHDSVTGTGIVLIDLSGDTEAEGNNLVDLSNDTENAAEIAVIGSAGSDTIIGNNVANSISGGAGDDTLTGGEGADTLTGGAGADTFVLLESVEGEAAVIGVFRDIITDFQVDIDKLQFDAAALSQLDGFVFDADGFGEGEQGDNFLVVGNGAVADQAYAQMLFDMTTGILSIDADGTGESEAVFIGTIGAGLSLTANDFLFVIPES